MPAGVSSLVHGTILAVAVVRVAADLAALPVHWRNPATPSARGCFRLFSGAGGHVKAAVTTAETLLGTRISLILIMTYGRRLC